MKKTKRQKSCLAVMALLAAAMVWLFPMHVNEGVGPHSREWRVLTADYTCSTPVCHTGNRTHFLETKYFRTCDDGEKVYVEYDIKKTDLGCCPYN